MRTHWSISPALAAWLEELSHERPGIRRILELGPGWSTSLLAAGWPLASITTIEHDWRFARQHLSDLSRLANVRLIIAPLVESPATGLWYDLADLTFSGIDLLLIDGPPGGLRPRIRAGAASLLPALSPGALVVLDDACRADESALVDDWCRTRFEALEPLYDGGRFFVWRARPLLDPSATLGDGISLEIV